MRCPVLCGKTANHCQGVELGSRPYACALAVPRYLDYSSGTALARALASFSSVWSPETLAVTLARPREATGVGASCMCGTAVCSCGVHGHGYVSLVL